jgi:superoxide dismutase, Fe-Mn family
MTDRYALPDLAYNLDALEPWCPAATLELHHGKHHATYVKEANAAAEELATADPEDLPRLAGLRTALTFNVAGHVLHSLFWSSVGPDASKPSPEMGDRIKTDFGSHGRFVSLLTSACTKVQGSGWGALEVDAHTGELRVGSILDHQNMHVPTANLLAVIDVWEHAYYLTHRNDRPAWVQAAIEHLDWTSIADRYRAARSVMATSR